MWYHQTTFEQELEQCCRSWQAGGTLAALEERLKRCHAQQPQRVVGILAQWATQDASEERAAFAVFALERLNDPSALDLVEPLLEQPDVSDERRLLLAHLVQQLGGEVDLEAIWERCQHPERVGQTLLRRLLDASHEPQAVAMFLKSFQGIIPDQRSEAIKDLLTVAHDPRAVRLWAPLLYDHADVLGPQCVELIQATPSPLVEWWLAELAASHPQSPFLRRYAPTVEAARAASDGPTSCDHAPGRFHQAFLSAPDGAGSRTLVFAQRRASGEIRFLNALLNDRVGVKDAFGGTVTQRRFLEMLELMRQRQPEGLLLCEVSRALASSVLRQAERLVFQLRRRFPEDYLAYKEACYLEGVNGERAQAEIRFEAFWDEATTLDPPTPEAVETFLRCPCAGSWHLLEESCWEGSLKNIFKRARRRVDRSRRHDAHAISAALLQALPASALSLWRQRLKDYGLITFLQGQQEQARLTRVLARSLHPETAASHPLFRALALKTVLFLLREEAPSQPRLRHRAPFERFRDWAFRHPKLKDELCSVLEERLGEEEPRQAMVPPPGASAAGGSAPTAQARRAAPGGGMEADEDEDDAQTSPDLFGLVVEWFLFDRPARAFAGKTPLEAFLEEASLESQERQVIQGWRHSQFGIFKVTERCLGTGVRVEHLATRKAYDVIERLGSLQLAPGMAVIGRLLPMPDGAIFGGWLFPFTAEMTYALERQFGAHRTRIRLTPLQVLDLLRGPRRTRAARGPARDLAAIKRDLAALLERWRIRWLSVDAIEERLRQSTEPPHRLGWLVTELLTQADAPPKTQKAEAAEMEELLDILMDLRNHVPLPDGQSPVDKTLELPHGPKEEAIIHCMMGEFARTKGEATAISKAEVETWLTTPQQELGGRTPQAVILEERKALGNPSEEIAYTVQRDELLSFHHPEILHRRAIRLQKEGDYDQAIALYEELLEGCGQDPERYKLLGNLGACYALRGEKRRGLRLLANALRVKPGYQLALANQRLLADRPPPLLVLSGELQGAMGRWRAFQAARLSAREQATRLVELITERRFGWPILEMEALIAHPHAFEAVRAAFDAGEIEEPFPFLVILGELRQLDALPFLREIFLKEDSISLLGVVAEAMARLGPATVHTFKDLLAADLPTPKRVILYGGLGLVASAETYSRLIEALERESEIKDAVAYALMLHGDQAAIPELYAAYTTWESPFAAELEDAIGMLAHPDPEPPSQDWRLRYRPLAGLERLAPPSLHVIGALSRALPKKIRDRRPIPMKKPLGQILEEQRHQREAEQRPRCRSCGEPLTSWWGLPSCSEMRDKNLVLARECLAGYRAQGREFVAEALDCLDLETLEATLTGHRTGWTRPARVKRVASGRHELLTLYRFVLNACLTKGLRTLAQAEAVLEQEAHPTPSRAD